MSASDKKQQRKAAMAEGLTQKQQREQNEARAAKQKKTIYTVVGVVCAVLAVALLVWNSWSGISTRLHGKAVAATVDGSDYTVGDLQYYYTNARQNFYYNWYQFYLYYGADLGFDPNVEDGAQWYNEEENQTYADYFRESALSSLKNTAALCAAAKAEGYTLSEEGQATIDSDLAQFDAYRVQSGLSWDNYLSRVFGTGVTKSVYVRNRTNDILADEYLQHHEDGIDVTEDKIQEYYTNNTDNMDSYTYRYFFINGTALDSVNEEGETVPATTEEKDAALAEAKAKADEALAEIQAAEDKEAAFIAAAPKYVSESSRSSYENDPDHSLQELIMGAVLSGNGSDYAAWLKDSARKPGDVTSIEATSGSFVVMFLNRQRDDLPAVDVRHILIRTDTTDSEETDENGYTIPTEAAHEAARAKAQALLDEWQAGVATEESFAALAEKHSEDGRDSETNKLNSPGGLYEGVYRGEMVPNFNKWVFEKGRKSGDVGLVDNVSWYSGWHIIYFSGLAEEPHWRTEAKKSLKKTIQDNWYSELTEASGAAEADGMQYVGSANTATPTPSASPAESAPVESDPAESPAAE